MRVLVTGGAGYIGTHTLIEVLRAGHEVVVIDNYVNSSPKALERVERLSNRDFSVVEASVTDEDAMMDIFGSFRPQAVIHFAALKSVSESASKPLLYHANNVFGTVVLLKAMSAFGCCRLIFSSSATVYGPPHYLPYDEEHPTVPFNAYGRTKFFAEEVVRDWVMEGHDESGGNDESGGERSAVLLRYFNPVGAHASGVLGEEPRGVPSNLMPYITQVGVGRLERVLIYGDDYATPDGTGVRDYIHVVDLARGHLAALDYAVGHPGCEVINIGTGRGYSVLEVVSAFIEETGVDIPYEIVPRRKGDIAAFYADVGKAKRLLGWQAEYGLEAMVRDSWRWQAQNPNGYK